MYFSLTVIRVLRREGDAVIFSFEYRMDSRLLIGDAVVTEKMLEKAVEAFEKQTGTDLRDFCAMVDEDGALTVLVEPFGAAKTLPGAEERSSRMEEAGIETEIRKLSGAAGNKSGCPQNHIQFFFSR